MSLAKDKKSTYLAYHTLAGVPCSMVGKYTVFDLRNEIQVRGKVVAVDGYMHVELEDCTLCNQRGEFYSFQSFYIKNRNIRYVHMPKGCKTESLLQRLLDQKPTKQKQRRTFKQSRAQRYQKEIIKEMSEK